MNNVEILYLDANKLVEQNELSLAYDALYDILEIDPGYGRAHNYLGWIYETKIKDFHKAKKHYELAIKFCQDTFPVVYINYIYLLIDHDDLREAENLIEKARNVQGVDFATLFYQKGKIWEDRLKFRKAYFYYNSAKIRSNNNDFVRMMILEMERIHHKMSLVEKVLFFFGIK